MIILITMDTSCTTGRLQMYHAWVNTLLTPQLIRLSPEPAYWAQSIQIFPRTNQQTKLVLRIATPNYALPSSLDALPLHLVLVTSTCTHISRTTGD